MTHNITEQEIKYALRLKNSELNNKSMEMVKNYFHNNPKRLETFRKLKDNDFKASFIKLLYNYNEAHLDLVDNLMKDQAKKELIEQLALNQTIEEETIEKFKEQFPNEIESFLLIKKVFEGLKTEREKLEKYVIDNLTNHSKNNDRIIKKIKEKEEEIEDAYWGFGRPEELLEDIEDGKLIETTITVLEKGDQDAYTHLKAIKVSEIKNKEIAGDLRGQLEEKSEDLKIKSRILEETNLVVGEQKERIKQLEEELEKERKRLAEANQIILEERTQNKQLREQLYSVNNLSKKRKRKNKVEKKGRKKIELQKLNEKKESQELITNIEVSAKYNN